MVTKLHSSVRVALLVALMLTVSIPLSLYASDKFGGGPSQSSKSGDGRYTITTNSSSRYASVDVRNNRTGDTASFRDWNGDGDYTDDNEQMTSNNRNGNNGNNGNNRNNGSSGNNGDCINGNNGRNCSGNNGSGNNGGQQCVAGGTCQTTVSNNQCGVAVNVSGTNRCSGGTRTCQAPTTVPVSTLQAPCTSFNDFDPDSTLRTDPTVVREGDPVRVFWDLGTSRNYHGNCTLRGSGIATNFVLTSRSGSVTIAEVTGPHQYTLSCGAASINLQLRVIPEVYES